MNINLTLIGQMIVFVIFVWFTKKFIWTPIINALVDRKAKIADGLAAAEKGHRAEEEGEQEALEVIAAAKTQAADILGKAERRGVEIVDESKDEARVEGERILTSARAEVENEVNKAKEALRRQVSELAVAGAGQILQREVDAKAHTDLLDKLVARL
ncbi:MAG: F0F1 ATP synthase subunit B [Pseudomonadota bacterium]|nr:F0F1 ATP synthase subunit B [Pseudomonadota bacterium]